MLKVEQEFFHNLVSVSTPDHNKRRQNLLESFSESRDWIWQLPAPSELPKLQAWTKVLVKVQGDLLLALTALREMRKQVVAFKSPAMTELVVKTFSHLEMLFNLMQVLIDLATKQPSTEQQRQLFVDREGATWKWLNEYDQHLRQIWVIVQAEPTFQEGLKWSYQQWPWLKTELNSL